MFQVYFVFFLLIVSIPIGIFIIRIIDKNNVKEVLNARREQTQLENERSEQMERYIQDARRRLNEIREEEMTKGMHIPISNDPELNKLIEHGWKKRFKDYKVSEEEETKLKLVKEERKREEEKYNLIKSDDGNELSENTSLPPLVLSNYHESSNIKIDMIHDVFINRFKELNIKGEVYAEREHVRELLGHLIVVVSDIRINIMRIDENKYCIQYVNNYELPDYEESQLNTHFENIFEEVINSTSFDSFDVFPLKLYCGRGLYGQTTDYQMELSIETEINSISMWGFTQYIFEIWKDLTKFVSIMERSVMLPKNNCFS